MVDFSTLAAVKVEDLPKATKLPIGSYIWNIDRVPEGKTSTKGTGTNVSFQVVCLGPVDPFDGDEEAVEAFEGGVAGVQRSLNFYLPESKPENMDENKYKDWEGRSVQNLLKFLSIHAQAEGSTLQELMANCINHQFVGTIDHTPVNRDDKDGEKRDEITRTAPLVA